MIDNQLELFGILVSFIFTVLVLSYALSDNILFRLAVHIFIGTAAGYAAAVALKDVLLPRLGAMGAINQTQMMVALVWILLLGMKVFGATPRISRIGNLAAALMVGVGAAVAVGGAIQGTLVPQISAASNFFRYENQLQALVWGSFALVGTITSLAHFHFSAKAVPNQIPKRARLIEMISTVGQVFISIALGVIFAGVYSAALLALIERFYFIVGIIDTF
jgi:hypothetical protein